MLNFTEDQTPIQQCVGEKYIFIDALYWMDAIERRHLLRLESFVDDLRELVFRFPFSDTPFAEFVPESSAFFISQIVKVRSSDSVAKDVFSTDTGLILVMREDILPQMLDQFSYDDLLSDPLDMFDKNYWNRIVDSLPAHSVGLISSPGISSGVDFDGSGRFRLTR